MKIKALSLSLLSAFILSACGGSDNDDQSYAATNINGTWSEFDEWFNNSGDYISITNNQLDVYDWENSNFILYSPIHAYEQKWWGSTHVSPFVLTTKTGLHDFKMNLDTGTYRLGTLKQSAADQWVINVPRDEGTGNLALHANFKEINISGKSVSSVFPSIEIDYRVYPNDWDANFMNSIKTKKFPDGSSCLLPKSLKSSEDNLLGIISAGDADDTDYDDQVLFDHLETKYEYFLQNTANTINKSLIYNSNFIGESTSHQLLSGAFKGNQAGLFYGVGIYAEKNQNLIASNPTWNANDTSLSNNEKVALENRCIYFNEKATAFLDDFNDQL